MTSTIGLCHGTGLIEQSTEDGPEPGACLGCDACQSPAERAAARRATAAVFAACPDDEAF